MGTCSSSGGTTTENQHQEKEQDQTQQQNGDVKAETETEAIQREETNEKEDSEPGTANLEAVSDGQVQVQEDAKRPQTHTVCRNDLYSKTTDIQRFPVPDDKVPWSVEYPEYKPVEFFAEQEVPIEEDPDFRKEDAKVEWNSKDGHVNRVSHQGNYEVENGVARNPVGRTGVCGRGRLARWGPNHAADPVVTRWKRDDSGEIIKDPSSGKPILQFISIKRGDTGQWAIPGGFVDSGEEAVNALKREFCEEALNSAEKKQEYEEALEQLFSGGQEVYRGYVDDPRNTDNAWMETVVVNFHDETGEKVGKLQLQAGDDAVGVQWKDIVQGLDLYASHEKFVQMVTTLRNANW